jgi:hypothetical protein
MRTPALVESGMGPDAARQTAVRRLDREPRAVRDRRGAWRRDSRDRAFAAPSGRLPTDVTLTFDGRVLALRGGDIRPRVRIWRLAGVAGRSPPAGAGPKAMTSGGRIHGRRIDIPQCAGDEPGRRGPRPNGICRTTSTSARRTSRPSASRLSPVGHSRASIPSTARRSASSTKHSCGAILETGRHSARA